jgi:hypothetical protein
VCFAINVPDVLQISLDHIPTLRGMHSALKNGEATVEEMFPVDPKPAASQAVPAAAKPAQTATQAAPAVQAASMPPEVPDDD